MEVILASASQRRSEILSSCGISHIVIPSNAKEASGSGRSVSETVEMNAVIKAETVSGGSGPAVIIGADTLVVHDGDMIGKPGDENEARDMLARFSGVDIEVYTGVCVIDACTKKKAAGVDKSSIRVADLSREEIGEFFYLLGPYDKAGGFSVEGVGSMIFDDIKGSYFNILGLPMMKLRELFAEIGLDILDFVDKP